MDKQRLYKILRISGSIVAFLLLFYLLSQQGWSEVLTSLQKIPTWRFVISVFLIIISRLAVAARWHSLLTSAGAPATRFDTMRITFAGLFASNFLPTTIGGDVVRLGMSLRMDWGKAVSAASLIVDRLVGMAGMATAAPIALIPILDTNSILFSEKWMAASVFSNLSTKVRTVFHELWQAFAIWTREPLGLLKAFLWTWFHQFSIFGIVWLILGGMGETVSFWLVGGFWSLTYFLTLLPISINGLGLQEISMTAIFVSLGDISVASAATAALLIRVLQVLASLPGVLFLPDIFFHNKELDET